MVVIKTGAPSLSVFSVHRHLEFFFLFPLFFKFTPAWTAHNNEGFCITYGNIWAIKCLLDPVNMTASP